MTIIFHFHLILIFIGHRWSKDVIENTEFKVCNFFSIVTFIVNGFFLVLLANVLKKLKKGFKLFGLRFYEECFVGNDIDGFEKYLETAPTLGKEHCVGDTYRRCNESDEKECVGTGIGEYIYKIKQSKSIVNSPGCFFFFYFYFSGYQRCVRFSKL